MSRVTPFAVLLALAFAAPPVSAATGVFREQAIPGSPAGATEVVRGPDGGFWFTEFDGNRIGTFSRDGVFREFAVPTPDSGPRGIAIGGGAVWFTEFRAGKIGKLTPGGGFTEYTIPSLRSAPWGITQGFGGMWFTESGANKIGRIAEDGTITERTIPSLGSEPRGIASAGATQSLANRIGVVRFFNVPSLLEAPVEEFPIPTSASGPAGLAVEYSQGSAWFTEKSAGQVGFISPDGRITEYPLSDRSSQPTGIFIDIETRFLEAAANRLVEIQPDAVLVGGAGTSGTWQTELRLTNTEDNSVTAFASRFPRPADISPSPPQFRRKIPPNGSFAIGAGELRLELLGIVFVRVLDDGVLPSVRARVFNANAPNQSVDLPTIRLSRLTDLNPSLLSFPGAVKSGAARSNLWLAEVSMREPLEVVIELIDPDGHLVASRTETLGAGGSVYLVDVIAGLGIASLPDGQLRVRKIGDRGLLWGYLATVDVSGAISLFSGMNP